MFQVRVNRSWVGYYPDGWSGDPDERSKKILTTPAEVDVCIAASNALTRTLAKRGAFPRDPQIADHLKYGVYEVPDTVEPVEDGTLIARLFSHESFAALRS